MTPVRIMQVERLAGRGHEHVRAFGYRVGDPLRLRVEVSLDPHEVSDLIEAWTSRRAVEPVVEVADADWMYCLSNDGLKLVELG